MCKDRGREGILDFGFQILDFVLTAEIVGEFVILLCCSEGVASFCNSIWLLLCHSLVLQQFHSTIVCSSLPRAKQRVLFAIQLFYFMQRRKDFARKEITICSL